ncbi:MAG: J domain-containing protein, partial [Leptolyngbya sp. SIO3F4]|nr:J domain-containing protein [Leptolyngbya sp. SIO3F4]
MTKSVSEDSPKNHYQLLGVKPTASAQDIRRAYRELSKLYHPDTTELSSAIATQKFQELNEAYGVLSNPEQRLTYDQKIGYSRFYVSQAPRDIKNYSRKDQPFESRYTYLDATDRPLSAGEIFALF